MSALAYKRQLEQIAGVTRDSAGMSGADLAQAALLAQTNMPTPTVMPDGGRLAQSQYLGAKDDFTGSNANINGRFLKNSPNRVWTVDGGGANFAISANTLVYDGVAARYCVVDTGLLDNFGVRFKQSAITSVGARVVLRGAASPLSVSVQRDQAGNAWQLIDETNGTISSFNDAVDLVANDVVECQVRGDNVTVLVNGVVRGVLTGLTGKYASGSMQGFRGVVGAGFTADDFYAYPLA